MRVDLLGYFYLAYFYSRVLVLKRQGRAPKEAGTCGKALRVAL